MIQINRLKFENKDSVGRTVPNDISPFGTVLKAKNTQYSNVINVVLFAGSRFLIRLCGIA